MGGRDDYRMPPETIAGNGAANRRARMLSPVGEFFAPVLSSAERPGWDRVLVEFHQTPEWEGEKRLPLHMVSVVLRPSPHVATRLDGGRMHEEPTAPGHIFVIPAGCNHWASWKRGTDFITAYLSPEALASAVSDDGLDAPGLEIAHRAYVYDPELAAILLTMQGQLTGPNAEDRLFVDTLGVQLAVQLARRHGTAPLRPRSYRHGLSRAKMSVVLDYMNTHLNQNIELAELAELVELSKFHFLRLFRTACGVTPHDYLVRRRVEVATSILLHEDASLAEVAYRLGFADQSHFTRHFRRITGAPPGRLRRERRSY